MMDLVPIPENELSPTIKERFALALGNLKGANDGPLLRREQ
jgi:hypothetical protein